MASLSLYEKWYTHAGYSIYWDHIKTTKIFLLCLRVIRRTRNLIKTLSAFSCRSITGSLKQTKTHIDRLKKILEICNNPESALFVQEFIKSPRTVGAVCPSSEKLAQCIAREITVNDNDIVIELGAGTGRVTKALLKQGLSPNRLVVIERSHKLATILQAKFPLINLIEGDAADLLALLNPYNIDKIQYVISSVPFRTLLPSVTDSITKQIIQLMNDDTRFIQFTYSLHNKQPKYFADFRLLKSSTVWSNVPPARVNVFTRGETTLVCRRGVYSGSI